MQAGVEELGYSETAEKLEEWNTVRFKYENIATKFAVQQMLR
ncbi:MAG TPA: hypothetical protein PK765_03775 [bacterium]|nr:hypothetical protein [bacterium]